MRTALRKLLRTNSAADLVLFCAPIAAALLVLCLYAQNVVAFAVALGDPLGLIADRSPGDRSQGALSNMKPAHQVSRGRRSIPAGIFPQERVLAGIRERGAPLADFFPADAVPFDVGPFAAPFGNDLALPSLGAPGTSAFSGSPGFGGGVPGAPFLPGASSPQLPDTPGIVVLPDIPGVVVTPVIETPVPCCTADVTSPSEATAAVPEPATWAMMILGFGMISVAVRRQCRRDARVTGCLHHEDAFA